MAQCFWFLLLCTSVFLPSAVANSEIVRKPETISISIPESSFSISIPGSAYDWQLVHQTLGDGGLLYRFKSNRKRFHLTVYMTKQNCETASECKEFEWNMSSIFGPLATNVESFERGRYSMLTFNIENFEGANKIATIVKAYTLQSEFMISVSTDAISFQELDPEDFLELIDNVEIRITP